MHNSIPLISIVFWIHAMVPIKTTFAETLRIVGGPKTRVIEITDPGIHENDYFGRIGYLEGPAITFLPNGDFVIAEPGDDSNGENSGAVHLYSGATGQRINSIYGETAHNQIGSDGILSLPLDRFAIFSGQDDTATLTNNGSVIIANSLGQEIHRIEGDQSGDHIGYDAFLRLANGNFVVASSADQIDGIAYAGSVMLINARTGEVIKRLTGSVYYDRFGRGQLKTLPNGNFVFSSPGVSVDGRQMAGIVVLADGTSGQVIARFAGQTRNALLGSGGLKILDSSDFLIVSYNDNTDGFEDNGSVILVDGNTGQAKARIDGTSNQELLGYGGAVTSLPNGNFVIVGKIGWLTNNTKGVARLVDANLREISRIAGDGSTDRIGSRGIAVLPNGNYLIISPEDSDDTVRSRWYDGSIIMVDSSSGREICRIKGSWAGGISSDMLGSGGIRVLPSGNFVIVSPVDDVPGREHVGSAILANGENCREISRIEGKHGADRYGLSGVKVLKENNNYVVGGSWADNLNGDIQSTGVAVLVDAITGREISRIGGDNSFDHIGERTNILANGNFLVLSSHDDSSGFVDNGSIVMMDGRTGEQIFRLAGHQSDQFLGSESIVHHPTENYFVVGAPKTDKNGLVNTGAVYLVRYE